VLFRSLGDEGNLASRIEGLSKQYGVTAIVGLNTIVTAPVFAALEIDLIRVKGKDRSVRIFALLGGQDLKENGTFKMLASHHEKMIRAYREQRWNEATEALEECLKIKMPEVKLEPLYWLYGSRIRTFQKTPPGPSWDGVTIADSK
jgi:adenylate cyclase